MKEADNPKKTGIIQKLTETEADLMNAKQSLSPGKKIPDGLIENSYSQGSYGIMENGKFNETLRVDPPGKKGPNYSHFHINGGKEHITDISKWPE